MIQKYGGKIICIFIPCFQRSSFQLPGIQAPSCQAGMTFGTSSLGFNPADSAQYKLASPRKAFYLATFFSI